ncbi:hypothetical protein TSAR_014637 [Trichomalopsis sarcophagae]|uniref:MD-2-related lipid-recognition domain-containing protein n=1 Tax=Trichomalopsis sarcophagae TaxID=543379 RepID=A0A232ESL1_9HYME|nr:hypothetical protein TSAR_014637 [Trichomalopsis sarcophagae]
MTKTTLFLIAIVGLIALTAATRVNECGSGKALPDTTQVQITNCDAPPCRLKRRTKVAIEQKFIPSQDVQSLKTSVHATILGIPLPFIGVDGTDACGKIFNAADNTPATCPLKQGTEYIYRNEFPVLPVYPTVALTVYWALKENEKPIACFEVPSRII